ncbi:MAG TPA: FUSC family protein [Steroidobacteraceae bacterium]|jgi:multidrug resistance protein MdtO
MATACSITVAISMVFRIPEPTYMAYIVFLISRDETAATITSGVGGLAAATIAILATLALSLVDLSEPALRLPAMAAITFLAMYSVRVFALGPITYLAGFVVVLLQSVVDDVPSPEQLTRLTLWVWVMLFVPIVTTFILSLVFGPSVELLREREFKRILSELADGLRAPRIDIPLERFRERVVELLEKKPAATRAVAQVGVTNPSLRQLLNLLVLLEVGPTGQLAGRGGQWADALEGIGALIGRPITRTHARSVAAREKHPSAHPAGLAIEATLSALRRAVEGREPVESEKKSGPRQLVAQDATTNPAHWQFALKTTFAVMIVYSTYTLLDWPGLRTSIVTCFFVALGSVGETVHKLTLRIAGALIGGILAGLCIVFVLPHCTDIGQLCLIVAVVSAGAAWVATSSEQLSYAGLQIAFGFFLGVLQDYAPATDLTVLRDRVAGILLGNIVITIVFSALWPQSAASRVRAAVGQVMRALAALIRTPGDTPTHREQAVRGLVLAEHFRTLRGFELQLVPGHVAVERIAASLRKLARLEGWVFVSTSAKNSQDFRQADRRALSSWALSAASAAESGGSWPAPPVLRPGMSESLLEVTRAAAEAVESAHVIEERP